MFFTREDINKIYQALLKLGIKDSELPETSDVKNDDTLAIVQDGKNKQINVREFLNQISLWKREDFINVTDKYKKSHITLVEAIQAIPIVQRKEGLVITFLDTENNWRIYQFRGSLLQFNNETLWVDLYDFSPYIIDSILPDEEDITQSAIDGQGNTYLSLKDREYNPNEFSGKGYKILRKNIIEIEDANSNKVKKNILTKEMISEPNTIYEVRYDFDLNSAEISIPEKCILKFEGGSFSNGILTGADTDIHFNNANCLINLQYKGSFICKRVKAKYFGVCPQGDGTIDGTPNQMDDLRQIGDFVRRCYDIEVEFEPGYYGYGGGSIEHDVSDGIYNGLFVFTFHDGLSNKPEYEFITKSFKIVGAGVEQTVFIDVYTGYYGSIEFNDGVYTPTTNLGADQNNSTLGCSGGFVFARTVKDLEKNINFSFNNFSVIKDLNNSKFGGAHPYTTNQSTFIILCKNNTYVDNLIVDGAVTDAFLIEYGENLIIKNSTIKNCCRCGLPIDSKSILIDNCQFYDNGLPRKFKWDNSDSSFAPDCTYNHISYETYDNPVDKDTPMKMTIINSHFGNTGAFAIQTSNMNFDIIVVNNCTFTADVCRTTYKVVNHMYIGIIETAERLVMSGLIYASESIQFTNCVLTNYATCTAIIAANPTLNRYRDGEYINELFLKTPPPLAKVCNITINTDKKIFEKYPEFNDLKVITTLYKHFNFKWNGKEWEMLEYGDWKTETNVHYGEMEIENIIANLQDGFMFDRDEYSNSKLTLNNITVNILEPSRKCSKLSEGLADSIASNVVINNCITETESLGNEIEEGNFLSEHIKNCIYNKYNPNSLPVKFSNFVNDKALAWEDNLFGEVNAYIINMGFTYNTFRIGMINPILPPEFNLNNTLSFNDFINTDLQNSTLLTLYKNSKLNDKGTYDYDKYYFSPPKTCPLFYVNNYEEFIATGHRLNYGETIYDIANKRLILGNNSKSSFYRYDGNRYDVKDSGTFAEKPNRPLTGFAYFCTDKQTAEGQTNGIMIYHKGNNVWVDSLGRVIS